MPTKTSSARLAPLAAALLALPLALTAATARAGDAPLPQPKLIGEVVLPAQLWLNGKGFGGLSDLSYDKATDTFYSISDDKGDYGPARFYTLKIGVRKGRFASLDITGEHDLMQPGGGTFPYRGADGEGFVVDPAHQRIFWSSEGDAKGDPQIYVAKMDGSDARELPLPAAYVPTKDGKSGARSNLSFEGLDLTADGKTLVVSTENALLQDGPKPSFTAGSPSRIMFLNAKTFQPEAQYVYMTDPIPAKPDVAGKWADNGVSALATLPDGRLVVVERNYTAGKGNNIRFYIVSTRGATNVNGQQKLDLAKDKPVQKTLWFEMKAGDAFGTKVDNVEDLAFGPVIDGKETMLTTTDDNFNRHQATRFKLFSVTLPKPAG